MNKTMCPYCFGPADYIISKEIQNEVIIRIYQCKVCKQFFQVQGFKYTPATCPGHQWEFIDTVYNDNGVVHTIDQIFQCDRCGSIKKIPRDTKRAGIKGRIELEHPKVTSTLKLNKSYAAKFLDLGNELNKFWSD